MKMQAAMDEIRNAPKGYMVSFAWISGGVLIGDHFPEKGSGEELIKTKDEAWLLAERFADATRGRTCNLYVVDHKFHPVEEYQQRYIMNR